MVKITLSRTTESEDKFHVVLKKKKKKKKRLVEASPLFYSPCCAFCRIDSSNLFRVSIYCCGIKKKNARNFVGPILRAEDTLFPHLWPMESISPINQIRLSFRPMQECRFGAGDPISTRYFFLSESVKISIATVDINCARPTKFILLLFSPSRRRNRFRLKTTPQTEIVRRLDPSEPSRNHKIG